MTRTKTIWGWLVGGLVALALVPLLGLVARGSAPEYPAPGFSTSLTPPPNDPGRPGITWAFAPGKGYAWFENNLLAQTGPGVLGSSPKTFPLKVPPAQLPFIPAIPTCPTCPNGQCPVPRRV